MKAAVVGGGVFGLSVALSLHARGHQVTVFEQGEIPRPFRLDSRSSGRVV